MSKEKVDNFINDLVQHKTPTTVFLINGVKLQGVIEEINPEGKILLERHGHRQVIYPHAVSTVSEAAPPKHVEA